MSLRLLSRKNADGDPDRSEDAVSSDTQLTGKTDELKRYLDQERYGAILVGRDKWREHPGLQVAMRRAVEAIDERFAMVPEGLATVPRSLHDVPGCSEVDYEISPFVLARHPVTNAQFKKFVADGGYQQLDLWPGDIWPHLIDFKDLTGESGPRFWSSGNFDKQLADHPVVGISYYEAVAYTQWAGYRLPTEAEWQMAASWRLRSSVHVLRRYPWGDALDTQKCNLWATGIGSTVPVTAYEGGAAPNGVTQLVGNVWEWTSSDFEVVDDLDRPIVGDMLMKSIRGGAFDTYFPSQATSLFHTGSATLIRAHNTGFRCAMDVVG